MMMGVIMLRGASDCTPEIGCGGRKNGENGGMGSVGTMKMRKKRMKSMDPII